MLKAILFAHEEIKKIVAFQEQIVSEIGKAKREFPLSLPGQDVKDAVRAYALDKVRWMFETFDRSERNAREEQVKADVAEHFAEEFAGREAEVGDALYALQKEVMRRHIIDEGVRPDGRKLTEVRPIWCETSVLPRPHGSAVFTRGQTQVMTVATLAPVSEQQVLDGISPDGEITEEARAQVQKALQAGFKPEFLNRMDETVMFKPLTQSEICRIARLMLEKTCQRMKEQGYILTVEDSALNYVASEAYTPQYGARPVKRYIQRHIETEVARIVMRGDLNPGDEVVVSADLDMGMKFDTVHHAEAVD